ncbi:NlpC/P60 family protein [Cognatishimia sp. 1_MG-2023]|uniref:NlpC/P60 family protein n=1 Tax=Cognatishimia sp. 1_MG-2023 TaxID=3062642 RepID=UPI0026E20989|nr:NlpC/P60 family protein [Cognatishimia sp. 1_MG-2023]MDO6727239.1 NlpC/P60 family protein [Cognatishimia sp. 1_MG-2023]
MSGDAVVALAREWIGTPYVHQASALGAGTDCLGLIRGVWRGLYQNEPEAVPAYTPDWAEAAGDEALWQAGLRHLVAKPLDQVAVGDVLLFRMRSGAVAKHLGIQGVVGSSPTFIHAYGGHAVVESPLSQPWARRVVARFAFPELTSKETN